MYTNTYTMEIINAREFRGNQKLYLDKVDSGSQIVLKRGKKSYLITPITEEDTIVDKELLDIIKQGEEDVKLGRTITVSGAEEIRNLLGL